MKRDFQTVLSVLHQHLSPQAELAHFFSAHAHINQAPKAVCGSGPQGCGASPVFVKTSGFSSQYLAAKHSIMRSIFWASPGKRKLHRNCLQKATHPHDDGETRNRCAHANSTKCNEQMISIKSLQNKTKPKEQEQTKEQEQSQTKR